MVFIEFNKQKIIRSNNQPISVILSIGLVFPLNCLIRSICIVSVPGLIFSLIHGFKSKDTRFQTDWNRLIFPTIFKCFELIYLMNLFIGYVCIVSIPGLISPLVHGFNDGYSISNRLKSVNLFNHFQMVWTLLSYEFIHRICSYRVHFWINFPTYPWIQWWILNFKPIEIG